MSHILENERRIRSEILKEAIPANNIKAEILKQEMKRKQEEEKEIYKIIKENELKEKNIKNTTPSDSETAPVDGYSLIEEQSDKAEV